MSAETSAHRTLRLDHQLARFGSQLSIDDPSLVYATTARLGSLSQTGGATTSVSFALRDFGRRDRNLQNTESLGNKLVGPFFERPDRTERQHDLLFPLQGDQFGRFHLDDHEELHHSIRSGRSCSRFDQPRIQHHFEFGSPQHQLQANGGAQPLQNSIGAPRTVEPTLLLGKNEINAGTAVPGVLNAVLSPGTIGGPNAYFVRTASPTRSARPTPETLVFTTVAEPISLPGLIAGGLTGNMSFDVNPGDLETHASGTGAENGVDPLGTGLGKYPPSLPKDNFTVVYTGQVYTDSGKDFIPRKRR